MCQSVWHDDVSSTHMGYCRSAALAAYDKYPDLRVVPIYTATLIAQRVQTLQVAGHFLLYRANGSLSLSSSRQQSLQFAHQRLAPLRLTDDTARWH